MKKVKIIKIKEDCFDPFDDETINAKSYIGKIGVTKSGPMHEDIWYVTFEDGKIGQFFADELLFL